VVPVVAHFWFARKQRLRDQIGLEMWAVYTEKNTVRPAYFESELNAIRYARWMSRKGRVAAVFRYNELIVRWWDGKIHEAPRRKTAD
jgi:hypothetical protein